MSGLGLSLLAARGSQSCPSLRRVLRRGHGGLRGGGTRPRWGQGREGCCGQSSEPSTPTISDPHHHPWAGRQLTAGGTVIWEPCLWTPNSELLPRLSGIGTDIAGGPSWTKYHQACLSVPLSPLGWSETPCVTSGLKDLQKPAAGTTLVVGV